MILIRLAGLGRLVLSKCLLTKGRLITVAIQIIRKPLIKASKILAVCGTAITKIKINTKSTGILAKISKIIISLAIIKQLVVY